MKRSFRPTIDAMEDRLLLSISAVAASPAQIDLSWNQAAGASSYVVREMTKGRWDQVANGNTTSYDALGLKPATTYTFDVGSIRRGRLTWMLATSARTASAPIASPILIQPPASTDHPGTDAGVTYSLAAGTLFGPGGPSYLDVHQGNLGDCWLLSSLAEVAARNPQVIRNMFTYVGNNQNGPVYEVQFFQWGLSHKVAVDTYLPDGGAYYDSPVGGVLWVALAEKAYVEANVLGYVTTDQVGSDNYSVLNDGDAAWALDAITGTPSASIVIADAGQSISHYWAAGDYICMLTNSPSTDSHLGAGHWYAVINCTPSSLELMNPWGVDASNSVWAPGDVGTYYGLFSCDQAFVSNYTAMTI